MGEKTPFYEYLKENGSMEDMYWYPKCYSMKKTNYLDYTTVDVHVLYSFHSWLVVNTPCLFFGKEYQPLLFELMKLSKQGIFFSVNFFYNHNMSRFGKTKNTSTPSLLSRNGCGFCGYVVLYTLL